MLPNTLTQNAWNLQEANELKEFFMEQFVSMLKGFLMEQFMPMLKGFLMEQFMLCWNGFSWNNSCCVETFFFHKTIHACVEFLCVEQFKHGIMPVLKVFVCGAIHAPVERVFHGSNSCSCWKDFSWNNSCPCWKFFMGQFTPVLKMF